MRLFCFFKIYINERDLPIKFSPKCILAYSADSAGFSVPCNVHVCPYLGGGGEWTKLFHNFLYQSSCTKVHQGTTQVTSSLVLPWSRYIKKVLFDFFVPDFFYYINTAHLHKRESAITLIA